MYIVTIHNQDYRYFTIHGEEEKLLKGNVVKGVNAIDTFSFSMLPSNTGFDRVRDYVTIVNVYNTNKDRYEFYGRVLYSDTSMSENGLITKDVTCESYLGFLHDSWQPYVEERNWTVEGLFGYIIDTHNSQVEDYKRFTLGEITVTDPNDNIYCGIQRESTWDTLNKKLIDVLGGEIRFRVDGDIIYLDYLEKIGEDSTTEIALSRNMKSITQEKDPSEIVTRLIPLGYKLRYTETDEEGNEEIRESEERLDISSINNGKNYIDDEAGIALYGIRVRMVEFDDIEVASTLLKRGEEWLAENNKVRTKYTANALELSLLGLDIDDFDVYNYYPIKNPLLDIDTIVRVVKKNIDVCEETKSTLELGEKFDSLSDLQKKQSDSLNLIVSDYVTNKRFTDVINKTSSLITQTEDAIKLEVTALYTTFEGYQGETTAALELKVGRDENDHIVSMINASADVVELNSNRLIVNSDNFKLDADGTITATNAFLNGTMQTRASKGNRSVTLSAGNIHVNGDWSAWDTTLSFKLMTFEGFNNDTYELVAVGILDEDGSFLFQRLMVGRVEDESGGTTSYPYFGYATFVNETDEAFTVGANIIPSGATREVAVTVHYSSVSKSDYKFNLTSGFVGSQIYNSDGIAVYDLASDTTIRDATFDETTYYIRTQNNNEFAVTYVLINDTAIKNFLNTKYGTSWTVAFQSDGRSFNTFTAYSTNYLRYDSTDVYSVGEHGWTNNAFKTITFANKNTIPDDLLSYLEAMSKEDSGTNTEDYATICNNSSQSITIGAYVIDSGVTTNIPAGYDCVYTVTAGPISQTIMRSNYVFLNLNYEETISGIRFDAGITYKVIDRNSES